MTLVNLPMLFVYKNGYLYEKVIVKNLINPNRHQRTFFASAPQLHTQPKGSFPKPVSAPGSRRRYSVTLLLPPQSAGRWVRKAWFQLHSLHCCKSWMASTLNDAQCGWHRPSATNERPEGRLKFFLPQSASLLLLVQLTASH